MLRIIAAALPKQLSAFANTTAPLTAGAHISSRRRQSTLVKDCDGVREIILNDPKARNPLSMATMCAILEAMTKNSDDEKLRCIVISSTGPVWSAGHNLKEIAQSTDGGYEIFNKLIEIIMNIYKSPVPVIAKVNGLATAAGCQLVASCDLVVASDKSSFATGGVNLGIFCTTPGIAITRVMPRLKSSYMLFTGFPINAEEANTSGLVSVVVPEAQLDAEMERVTNSIKTKSRAVLAMGKRFYYKQFGLNIKDAYTQGAKVMQENICMDDGQEGLRSFVEKRKPKWTNK